MTVKSDKFALKTTLESKLEIQFKGSSKTIKTYRESIDAVRTVPKTVKSLRLIKEIRYA